MSQSRLASAIETVVGTAIGFAVSFVLTHYVMPAYGYHVTPSDNLQITAIFTIASLARGFLVRRMFNAIKGKSTA